MKNINIGYANLCISDILKKSYFNNDFINESTKLTNDFLNTIKDSKLLMLEFKVFNNIENKTIDNDTIGTRYIDKNIKLFETYTVDEIITEHQKLIPFINETVKVDQYKNDLYEAISNLIIESVSSSDDINIDDIHESFIFVLNHLKKDKQKQAVIVENVEPVNEDVIEIAISKFNEKYSDLVEEDRRLIKTLINATHNEKQSLFENYKAEVIKNVNNLDVEKYGEKIDLTINKINEMKNDVDTIDGNIIKLHELKKGFL